MDKQLYMAVLDEFKTRKNHDAVVLKEKIAHINSLIPRLGEIETELSLLGLSLVTLAMNKDADADAKADEVFKKQQALKDERAKILLENGYSEDEFLPKYRCNKCQDEGFVDNKMCSCFQTRMTNLAYEKSDLASMLKTQTFDKFDLSKYPDDMYPEGSTLSSKDIMLYAYNRALSFVSEFDKDGKSLLFYGNPGLGKTFLSTCIAKELLDKGKSVVYQSSGKVFAMLEEYKFGRSSNPDEVKSKIDMLFSADLLILDDLGTEFMTSYVNSAVFDIINTRIVSNKKTIISTNYSPSEIATVYSERVVSRLLGHYEPVMFFGPDLRING